MKRLVLALLIFSSHLLAENDAGKQIEAFLAIEYPLGAVFIAKDALKKNPQKVGLYESLIDAYGMLGEEALMMQTYQELIQKNPKKKEDLLLLEKMAWHILKRSAANDSLYVRYLALVGATLTRDIQASILIHKALNGTNALFRQLAADLSPYLRDAMLQEDLIKLVKEEKDEDVRLSAIQALGMMEVKKAYSIFSEILSSKTTSMEEKQLAAMAVAQMSQGLNEEELQKLVNSDRAGLRLLSAQLVFRYGNAEMAQHLKNLLSDTNLVVRANAIYVRSFFPLEPIPVQSLDPDVAIAMAYSELKHNPLQHEPMKKLLFSNDLTTQRKASAAIASCGKNGIELAKEGIRKNKDEYVRVNLALALLNLNEETKLGIEVVSEFLDRTQNFIMWDSFLGFSAIVPSEVRHHPFIPQLPETVDQLARLDLLNRLVVKGCPHALEKIKAFLKERKWSVNAMASQTLLQEGDKDAIDLVKTLLQSEDVELRVQAALMIAFWGREPESISVLEKAYPEAHRELKLRILEALGFIGERSSIPFLLEAMQDPFQGLRTVAASAMIQCINH